MPPTRGLAFLGRTSECRRRDDMVMRTRDVLSTLLGIRGEPGTVTIPRDVGCGRTDIGAVLLSACTGDRHLITRLNKTRRDATDAVQGVVSAGALRPSLPSS